MRGRTLKTTLVAALAALLMLSAGSLMAQDPDDGDTLYEEAFEIPPFDHEPGSCKLAPDTDLGDAFDVMGKATAAATVFTVATATNPDTTGHGNVRFRVSYSHGTNQFSLLLWSQRNYLTASWPWCTGYRKWYRVNSPVFGSWPYAGGALCVGFPPAYNNMHENIQILDFDNDGDQDVFMMLETSPKTWTVYLYKNLENN